MKKEEGKYYHVYNRGNNKENIFFAEENYPFFLEKFKSYLIPHVDVFAYCLMPNHFHFFIRINDLLGFEKGIKNFLFPTQKLSTKNTKGSEAYFRGRYKISEINSDAYFTRIITYIHQNPLASNLVAKLEDYKFSSYKSYLSPQHGSTLKREEVLDWFGGINEFIKRHEDMETYEVLKTS